MRIVPRIVTRRTRADAGQRGTLQPTRGVAAGAGACADSAAAEAGRRLRGRASYTKYAFVCPVAFVHFV
jgi:hypothetical protein